MWSIRRLTNLGFACAPAEGSVSLVKTSKQVDGLYLTLDELYLLAVSGKQVAIHYVPHLVTHTHY